VSATHYSEDDLTLYYYGEARRRDAIERHLEGCPACASVYRDISATLAMIAPPEAPERGDQYGLEVWQRIRHKLPERPEPWWTTFFRRDRLVFAAAAAMLVIVAFVAGRVWPRPPAGIAPSGVLQTASGVPGAPGSIAAGDTRQRILLTSVADHLDRSERMLTDIMNAADRRDISSEQRWADDLLTTSRLYRQDAVDAGEQSVAMVLDDLERSLLEIVNRPSKISAADLEQIRRRIDAAALLFKVRVMSDELRRREDAPDRSTPRTSTRKIS
jgi:hypothetical protein